MTDLGRRLVTALPGPRSAELGRRLSAAGARAIAGPTAPSFIDHAEGAILVDVDGNQLLDLGSGIAVATVGNTHPAVAAAAGAQTAKLLHTCAMVAAYEPFVQVLENLRRITPGDHAKRSILVNSGAEAVENAVKVARYHTGRQAVVVFEHAYHGRTNLTLAMTAKAMPYKAGFGPLAPEVYRLPNSYPYRDGLTGPAAAQRAITKLDTEIGADKVAALVIEPIQGEGGFIVPAPGFLPALQDFCQAHGIVFVADEIQSGVARTGKWFASDWESVVPDVITVAKGIGGGLPLAAVTGRQEIMDSVHPGGLGGTYGGNPVSCVASVAVVEAIEREGLLDKALAIGQTITRRWTGFQEHDPRIGDVRGRGAMQALELVDPKTKAPNEALARAVAGHALSQGVVVLVCGTFHNVIRLLPPLAITAAQLEDGLDVIAQGLARN
ncbi:MAG: 4-aminobutyrate--2-oxoglutarate transaminase [Propionibacteriaceae bacterium]|jgi:4-aminobutyrate aminotransferase/(S)-3-amino-2-methylpropionate transaminase|nr:4-aminobutyrate--2-oxoglutarate transaminase [Propionibacteriaceae bacterium]